MEKTTGRILYSKNENEVLPMASLTKIITAIVVIENNDNLERVFEIPKEATGIEGSSIYLKTGEKYTILELLYGLMLRSGNDSAIALAIATSGSLEKFMELANKFCIDHGLLSTRLTSPHGLDNANHYTSAENLAKISCYALKNAVFAKIVSTQIYNVPANETHEARVFKNKNRLLGKFDGATGIKTGYTEDAGRCFVGSAKRNGMEVVCVLLNCNPMFEDCSLILDEVFDEYHMTELLSEYQTEKIKVSGASVSYVDVALHGGFSYPLKATEMSDIHMQKSLPDRIDAPICANQLVGQFEIYFKNDLIFSQNFYTIKGVSSNAFSASLKKIIEAF
ncbi:MAG: D-alanyl-D-alanine carboxypeptidase [Clostridia bacterium]|nr:D-alanyl-D-alanine carboxypeptidase [Clostridia bacterium]